MNALQIPNAQTFNQFRVTDPNQSEVLTQGLYDFQLYPAAGQADFVFFANPVGQGVTSTFGAVVGSNKTYYDTNMDSAAQLPSGMEYLMQGIEVIFQPGSSAVANTFVPTGLTTDATGVLAAAPISAVNDMKRVYSTGMLTLRNLQKDSLRETPLQLFPPRNCLRVDSSLAVADTNVTTSVQLAISSAYVVGDPYVLDVPISLQPATNFRVTISTPAAQALPSGFNGRIGVRLTGYLRRAAQ